MMLANTHANWGKGLLVCAIPFSWGTPCAARSGTIDGAMGQISSASIGISVQVSPRFTVQRQRARRSSATGDPHGIVNEANQVCIESNSESNFTVLLDPADYGSPIPQRPVSSSSASAGGSACIELQAQRGSGSIDRASGNATTSLTPDDAVTLLISPL